MTEPRFKAVIFDMDGLVLDSETTYVAAWQRAATAMGYTFPETFWLSLSGLHGESVEQYLLEQCSRDFDVNSFKRLSGEYWREHVQQYGIPVKKGFFTLLAVVEHLKLPFCLATNSRRREVLQCLNLAGLEQVFPQNITRDDVAHAKPAPDIFIAAASLLGMAIEDCLVLEDSPIGVAAAVTANAQCICVPSVYPLADLSAANVIAVMDDLEQVADFILACSGQGL